MTTNSTMTNIKPLIALESSFSSTMSLTACRLIALRTNGVGGAVAERTDASAFRGQPLLAPGLSLLITLTLAVRSARCCSTLDQEGRNVSP